MLNGGGGNGERVQVRADPSDEESDLSECEHDDGDKKSFSSLNPNGKLEIVEGVQPELQNNPLESEATSEFF